MQLPLALPNGCIIRSYNRLKAPMVQGYTEIFIYSIYIEKELIPVHTPKSSQCTSAQFRKIESL